MCYKKKQLPNLEPSIGVFKSLIEISLSVFFAFDYDAQLVDLFCARDLLIATGFATGEGETAGIVGLQGVQGLGQPVPVPEDLGQNAGELALHDVEQDRQHKDD